MKKSNGHVGEVKGHVSPRLAMAGMAVAVMLTWLADPGGPAQTTGKPSVVDRNLAEDAPEIDTRQALSVVGRTLALLEDEMSGREAVLRRVEVDRALTVDRYRRLTSKYERIAGELRAARGRGIGEAWRIDRLQQELDRVGEVQERELGGIRQWLDDRTAQVTSLIVQLGMDHKLPGEVVEPAAGPDRRGGSGGPLQLVEDGFVELPSAQDDARPMATAVAVDFRRLESAERLLAGLPLAAPLDYFYITSPYGRREDPLTHGRAIHGGLDLGAARGSRVRATARGRVVRAGRAGAYGILVEIEHEHGVITRYGHLSKALVSAGDEVGLLDPIGIIGSTGRSTGIHLHYEIRVDGMTRNPGRFIEAGRSMMALFQS
ncbi:MAG: M23 family metallopeptidase [Geminicoccaceae bacterium]|nr:M23 family metallopeptidase [Geminicoccaceae bacterium]